MRRILYIAIVILMGACGRSHPGLPRAEAIMDSLPDSALAILEGIDADELSRDDDRALYGLLLTQARHKTDSELPSDSIIYQSARWYDKHPGQGQRRMLSHFYQGLVLEHQGMYSLALTELLTARDLAAALGLPYWQARAYEAIADVYYETFNLPEAARWYDMAAYIYNENGDDLNSHYASKAEADALAFRLNPQRAIMILDSLMQFASNNTVLQGELYSSSVRPYLKLGQYENAVYAFQMADSLLDAQDDKYLDFYGMGIALYNLGEIDLLNQYLVRYDSVCSGAIYESGSSYLHYLLAFAQENTSEALSLYQLSRDKDIEALIETDKYNLIGVSNQYHAQILSENTTKHKQSVNNYLRICTALGLLLIVALYIMWYFRRKARKDFESQLQSLNDDLRKTIDEHERLTATCNEKSIRIEELKKSTSLILNQHFSRIDSQTQRYLECGASDKLKKTLYAELESSIKSLSEPKALSDLQKMLDVSHNGIITRLKQQCPSLNEKQINLFAMRVAGISAQSISFIMNTKTGSIYTQLSRLRKAITTSEAKDVNEFLSYTNTYN